MKRIDKSSCTITRIKKIDAEKQIVFGEVYKPSVLDTHGDFITAEDIEIMAHRFMQLSSMKQAIDTNHDEVSNGSYPVESFIARAGDPDYTEGAWVLGVKVVDKDIWDKIKKGELNGYSFQALVRKNAVVVSIEMNPDAIGFTEKAEDDHDHVFLAYFDGEGKIVKGVTSTDAGHYHEIKAGTATEMSQDHAHRIDLGMAE